ncbi:hypothetical protein JTB14_000285 [Gonioctena quinquepunctata]|nr:hypothetical protein JTB14_000285 [Gonioctena quinquepunctata]
MITKADIKASKLLIANVQKNPKSKKEENEDHSPLTPEMGGRQSRLLLMPIDRKATFNRTRATEMEGRQSLEPIPAVQTLETKTKPPLNTKMKLPTASKKLSM